MIGAKGVLLGNKMDEMDTLIEKRIAEGRYGVDLKTGLNLAGWHAKTRIDKAVEYFMFDFENGVEPDIISGSSYGYTGKSDLNF